MTERKGFAAAVIIWFLAGGIGGHRVYVTEKLHYLAWYWALTLVTFGIAPIIGLFRIKRSVLEANNEFNRTGKEIS